ncbi:hypothetical protein K0A97_02650 [Patescibacteria group bacterium]|nr:hypothetical protein [Patescibacteria group bacterium]
MNKKKFSLFIKPKPIRGILVYLSIFFFFITLFFFFIEMGLMENPLKNFGQPPQSFNIIDRCSLIAGQLIHPIETESDCASMCMAECEVRSLKFYSSNFTSNLGNCNDCICLCK